MCAVIPQRFGSLGLGLTTSLIRMRFDAVGSVTNAVGIYSANAGINRPMSAPVVEHN